MGRAPRRGRDGRPGAESDDYGRPVPSRGVNPIGTLAKPGKVTVEGRVRSVEIRPVEQNSVLAAEIADSTGQLTALFYGRSRIPGLICGARVRFRGPVGLRAGHPFMVNPTYELIAAGPPEPDDRGQSQDSATDT
jgi:RecG-like helicase